MPEPGTRPDRRFAPSDLSVAYGSAIVINGIDLAVPDGAFTALLGPNGSGKSTLLRALAGLLPARAGTVLLDGRSIASRSGQGDREADRHPVARARRRRRA